MKTLQTILAATALSAPAHLAVERAFRLAAFGRSELHMLHALELDTLDSLHEMLGDDLSAVKHGLHIAEELLLGSVTRHVLAESQCDLLVICDPRQTPEESP